MKHTRSSLSGAGWLCLAATAFLAEGCAHPVGWNGIFAADVAGAARVCAAPTTSPPDGVGMQAKMQVSNEGGWCGLIARRGGVPYDSYLLVARPNHGRIFAHRVGGDTRIDYIPDTGFAGTDGFAVRMIPGNSVIESTVTVIR